MTPLALAAENASVLRRLNAGRAFDSVSALARELDRDPSNFRKSLSALEEAGLVNPEGLTLTDAARAALRAIDVADDQLPVAETSAPHSTFVPNPLQPRKLKSVHLLEAQELVSNLAIGPAEATPDLGSAPVPVRDLVQLALSIRSQGVLQPLLAAPPDARGARMLVAGERRWRAAGMLLAAGIDFPGGPDLPFVEREADEAAAQALALVENNRRADLTPLERARAYAELCRLTGWSARRAAMETGETVRVVQEALQVLREAHPTLLAAHEDGQPFGGVLVTWERLRESIRDARPVLPDAPQRPAREPDLAEPDLPLEEPTGSPPVHGGSPRAESAGEGGAESPPNPPESATRTLDAEIAAARAAAPQLTPRQALAMVELAHKITHDPAPAQPGRALVGAFWSDPDFIALARAETPLIEKDARPGERWTAAFTEAGLKWLGVHGYRVKGEIYAEAHDVLAARVACGFASQNLPPYAVGWLNDPASAAAGVGSPPVLGESPRAEGAGEGSAASTDTPPEDHPDDAEAEAAESVLAAVQAFTGSAEVAVAFARDDAPRRRDGLIALATKADLIAPFRAVAGRWVVELVDAEGRNFAQVAGGGDAAFDLARAELIAFALNATFAPPHAPEPTDAEEQA